MPNVLSPVLHQDITSYLPADSETRQGLSIMDEQFMTYGSARIMVSNITWQDADALVEKLEAVEGVKEVAFDDSADHYNKTNALFDVTFDGAEDDEISKDAKQAVKELLDAKAELYHTGHMIPIYLPQSALKKNRQNP